MSLAYQRAARPASGWEAWGTLVYGTTRISLRKLVVFGGIAVLLLTLLLRHGEAGIGQLWASALLSVPLLGVGSLTRTVGLRLLGRLLLIGAALMGAMYLVGVIVITPLLDEISRPRDFAVPAIEQVLVMLPLVVLVWRWRDGRAWSLGATDLLLAGVAVGIGFGLMEHAYLRADSDWLEWLPLVGYHPLRLTPGHAIWAGLGGATLGLGLLMRSRGPIWLAVAASGSLLGFLDHAANNNANWGDELSGLLNLITLNGWLAVLAFLALAAACIGVDRAVQRQLEPLPHREMPPRSPGLTGLIEAWEFVSLRRRLGIADWHWRRAIHGMRDAPGREADGADRLLALAALRRHGALSAAAPVPARPIEPDETPPPLTGTIGAMLLVGAGAGIIATAAGGSASAGVGALLLAALDVGANCDAACLASGAGGLGGSSDPGGDDRLRRQEEAQRELERLQQDYRDQRRRETDGPSGSTSGPGSDVIETIKDNIANWRDRVPDRPGATPTPRRDEGWDRDGRRQ